MYKSNIFVISSLLTLFSLPTFATTETYQGNVNVRLGYLKKDVKKEILNFAKDVILVSGDVFLVSVNLISSSLNIVTGLMYEPIDLAPEGIPLFTNFGPISGLTKEKIAVVNVPIEMKVQQLTEKNRGITISIPPLNGCSGFESSFILHFVSDTSFKLFKPNHVENDLVFSFEESLTDGSLTKNNEKITLRLQDIIGAVTQNLYGACVWNVLDQSIQFSFRD